MVGCAGEISNGKQKQLYPVWASLGWRDFVCIAVKLYVPMGECSNSTVAVLLCRLH